MYVRLLLISMLIASIISSMPVYVAEVKDNSACVIRLHGIQTNGTVEFMWGGYRGVGRVDSNGDIVYEVNATNIRSRAVISGKDLLIELDPVPLGYKIARIAVGSSVNIGSDAYVEIIEQLTVIEVVIDVISDSNLRIASVRINNDHAPYTVNSSPPHLLISLRNIIVDLNKEITIEISLSVGQIFVNIVSVKDEMINVNARASANVSAINVIVNPMVAKASQKIALSVSQVNRLDVARTISPVNVVISRYSQSTPAALAAPQNQQSGQESSPSILKEAMDFVKRFRIPLLLISLFALFLGVIFKNILLTALSALTAFAVLLVVLA